MKYLWILSRTPEMEEARYREIVLRLARVYDVSGLVRTEQRGQLRACGPGFAHGFVAVT